MVKYRLQNYFGNLDNFQESFNSFMYLITPMVVIAFEIKQLFWEREYQSSWTTIIKSACNSVEHF